MIRVQKGHQPLPFPQENGIMSAGRPILLRQWLRRRYAWRTVWASRWLAGPEISWLKDITDPKVWCSPWASNCGVR